MEHANDRFTVRKPQGRLPWSLPQKANTLAAEWYGSALASSTVMAATEPVPHPADHYSRTGAYLGHPERKHSAYGLVTAPGAQPDQQAAPSREEKTIRGVLPD